MNWFSGDIASAINKCKADNAVLTVYIYDSSSDSETMNEVWTDPEIAKVFDDRFSVPLKLQNDSVGGTQFAQFYPVTSIPSTHFINAGGQGIFTIQGVCTKEELKRQAESTLKLKSASAAASQLGCGETESEEEISANTTYSAEEKEAKLQRARELIAIKQQDRAEKEKEKEKSAETERRKLGRDMAKLKEYKSQQEAKETRDSLRKDKEDTRLAREKVREQIQRDREARNLKYQEEKREKAEELKLRQQQKLLKESEEAAKIAAANSLNARIQFRLPDGSSFNHTFEATQPLVAAIDVITTSPLHKLGPDFRLATIYPRRVFTSENYSQTFRDLELTPSCALLVLPPAAGGSSVRSHSSGSGTAGLTYLFSIIFSPLLVVWNFVRAFLFATPQQLPSPEQSSPTVATPPSASRQATRPPASDGTRQRRVGRLSDLSNNDDEQNTWNGNSTQQK